MFAQFKTLPQLFDYFKDEETCLAYWEHIHWGKTGVICPHCNAGNPYKTNRGYKCKNVVTLDNLGFKIKYMFKYLLST